MNVKLANRSFSELISTPPKLSDIEVVDLRSYCSMMEPYSHIDKPLISNTDTLDRGLREKALLCIRGLAIYLLISRTQTIRRRPTDRRNQSDVPPGRYASQCSCNLQEPQIFTQNYPCIIQATPSTLIDVDQAGS